MVKRIGSHGAALAPVLALVMASAAWAAPAWNPTSRVSPAGAVGAYPVVAVDAHGNAVALWMTQGANLEVVYSDHPAGGRWTTPVVLSDPSQGAVQPVVATDAANDTFAAWDGGGRIRASYRRAGGSWQATPNLLGDPALISYSPTLAVDAHGDEVLGWLSSDGNYTTMWGAYRPAGGSWTASHQLSPSATHPNASQPAVAIDSHGNAAVVWSFHDGNALNVIWFDTYDPITSAWAPTATSLSSPAHNGLGAKVAFDGAGELTAIWADDDLVGHEQILGRDWTTASNTLTLQYAVSPVGTTVKDPSLAFDPSGNAIAAWSFNDATGTWVQSSTRTAGGSWPAQATDISNSVAATYTTAIATGANGEAIVAWHEKPVPGVYHVDAAVKPAGAAWSAPHDAGISITASPTANAPAVAVDGHGNAVAVWDQSGTGTTFVQAATYSAPTIKTASIPGSGVVGQPVSFSVNPFDVWSPLSTTWNFGDGTQAVGTTVKHTYTSAGKKTVTVGTANAGLATATSSGSITISSPSSVAPRLTAVSQSNRSWARSNKLARLTAKRKNKRKTPVGTTFSLTLDQAATLKFAFSRTVTGRSVGKRCVARARSNRKHHPCKLNVKSGSLTLAGHAGKNKVAFFGQLTRTRRLGKGAYTVSITATGSGGKVSSPATLKFTIVK